MQTKFLNLLFYKKKILKIAYFSGTFPVNVPLKMMEKVGRNIALHYNMNSFAFTALFGALITLKNI